MRNLRKKRDRTSRISASRSRTFTLHLCVPSYPLSHIGVEVDSMQVLPRVRVLLCLALAGLTLKPFSASGQTSTSNSSPSNSQANSSSPAAPAEAPSTNTDLFVMAGSDIDRPGLLPRANYNIGIGHTFGFLKRDPIGDELTFAYTYENAGTHGFLHTAYGEHTEQI